MTKQPLLAIGYYQDWDHDPMAAAYDVHRLEGPDDILTLPEALRTTIKAIAFKGHDPLGAPHFEVLPNLGIVANFGVGYDAIDIAAAQEKGIQVTNTPDVLNDDVADLAVGMLIALSRQIPQAEDWVRSGRWSKEAFPLNRKMSGRRAGIMGLGRIGREIADRLAAFKMDIHYHARSPKDTPEGWTYHADPVELAAAVDDLIVILVGGPATEGYVSAEVLKALGPDGVIVNVSRGTTIDEDALLAALEAKTIRGAALDVFLSEPDLDPRFLTLDNVLLQPHQGSATSETRQAMGQLQRDNIAAFFAQTDLLTPVN